MYAGLHVKYPLILSDFNETWFFWQIFVRYSNNKFNENLSSGSRGVPCGRTDGQTYITKLSVVFCNFVRTIISLFLLLRKGQVGLKGQFFLIRCKWSGVFTVWAKNVWLMGSICSVYAALYLQWMWSETQVPKNRVLTGNTRNVRNFIFYLTVHNNLDV